MGSNDAGIDFSAVGRPSRPSLFQAFAVGGQSERGDTKREQMKREYAALALGETNGGSELDLVNLVL